MRRHGRRFGVVDVVVIACVAAALFVIFYEPFSAASPGTPFSHTDNRFGVLEIQRDGIYLGRVRGGGYVLHDARIECFSTVGHPSYSIKGSLAGGGSNSPISIFRAEMLIDGEQVELEATHRLGAPARSGWRGRRSVSQESISVKLPLGIRTRLATAERVSLNLIGLRDETGVIELTEEQVRAMREYLTTLQPVPSETGPSTP